MNWKAQWIKPAKDTGDVAPAFAKSFRKKKEVKKAILAMTALGVYEAKINGQRISNYVLAPGWTSYETRFQYQEYDVTGFLGEKNLLLVTVGKGWYRSKLSGPYYEKFQQSPCGLIAQLEIVYEDGTGETIISDESWKVSESEIRFSEIYDGEVCDARIEPTLTE